MPYKVNPFTGTLDYYETGSGGGGGGSTVVVTHVANYAALPDPTTVADDAIYIADASQGTAWLPGSLGGTYYPAGFYSSDGVAWIYAGSASQATLSEVNTGTNNDKFVTPSTFTNADKWGTKFDQPSGTTSQYILGDGSLATIPSVISSIDDLSDVVITNPLVNQLLQFNGSEWVNASGTSVSAGPGATYFLTDVSAGVGSYEYFSKIPDSGNEVQESVTVNNNTVLIHEYISDSEVGKTSIDAGIWEFNFFSYVDHYHASFVVNTYKRTSGGVETLLFSVETDPVSWISTALTSAVTVQQAFVCNTTDKIVVKISGKSSGNGNTLLTLVHSGTQHYSHFHTPLILLHNDIAGLQGGASGEYYHLSSSDNTTVTGWTASGIPDSDIQSATTWNGKQEALVSGTNIKTVNGSSILGSGNLSVTASAPLSGNSLTMVYNTPDAIGNFSTDTTTASSITKFRVCSADTEYYTPWLSKLLGNSSYVLEISNSSSVYGLYLVTAVTLDVGNGWYEYTLTLIKASGTFVLEDTYTISFNKISLMNSEVVGSTITGYSSTTGTVSSSDTLVQAISKLNGNNEAKLSFKTSTKIFGYRVNSSTAKAYN